MTDGRDRGGTGYQARAADSAACLLVIAGYEQYDKLMRRVVTGVKERVLMSPTLGDFIDVRFCGLGPRPRHPGRSATEVARIVLELTSRPRDVARNFSAVVVFDQSALIVDGLLQACAGDPALQQLNARCLGMASWENRPDRKGPVQSQDDISVAREGSRSADEFVFEIYGLAEQLLNDFGSGWQAGVRPEAVSRLGSEVAPTARGVIKRATIDEGARSVQPPGERAEGEALAAAKRKAAQRQEQAAQEAAVREGDSDPQRAGTEPLEEAEVLASAKQQIAELERVVADLRRGRDGVGDPPAEVEPLPAVVTQNALERGRDREPQEESAPLSASVERSPEPGGERTPGQEGEAPADRTASGWQRIRGMGEGLASRVRSAPTGGPDETSGAAVLLSECVKRLKAQDTKGAEKCLPALRRYASAAIGLQDRAQYRAVMIEDHALSPHLPLGSLAGEFYDVLMKLVYGQPFGYREYRDLGYCLERAGDGALPPVLPLIKAIDRTFPTDPLVLALTRYYLSQSKPRGDGRPVRPSPGDARRLIGALAEAPLAERDADPVFAVLARYLSEVRASSERKELTGLLRECSYLATTLARACPEAVSRQVANLVVLLRWAYPDGLTRDGVETLTSLDAATSALLPAILHALARPSDRPWAIKKFLHKYSGRDINLAQAAELEPEIMRLSAGGGSLARK